MIEANANRVPVLILAVVVAVLACQMVALAKPHRHSRSHGSTRPTKSALQASLGQKNKQIKVLKHKIAVTEIKRKDVLGQLSTTEQKLDNTREDLARNMIKLQNAQGDLQRTNDSLARTIKQLGRRRDLLSRRVVDIYEGEDLNYVDVVLGASDMWTFLTRTYYLQRILDSDTTLIDGIKSDKEKIERDRIHKAQVVSSVATTQSRLATQADEIATLAEQKRQTLQAIEHDKDLMQKALDELEAESRRIEGQIQQYQASTAGRRRDRIATQTGVFHGGALIGGLSYPCSGRITSRFAYRLHPITHVYKLHTGIDIAVHSGTPLHAAADGTVMEAVYNKAYGYMITIYHGGGISTLYGHCSRLLVHGGQEVKKGQLIALSGSTGYSTGPHCHFEKRVNGTPVNPEQ